MRMLRGSNAAIEPSRLCTAPVELGERVETSATGVEAGNAATSEMARERSSAWGMLS